MTSAKPRKLLQANPEPIKVVPAAQRDVWTRDTWRWRCDHMDGRGCCTSRETRPYWNKIDRSAEFYCEKHMPAKSLGGPEE